jgi:polysaccharide biosynthesis protein PelC
VKKIRQGIPLAVIAVILSSGCAPSISSDFLILAANVNNINCIAVLPLENNTQYNDAGNVISDILSVALMNQGGFNVMDSMEVERVLRERGIYTPDGISPENAAGMGIILGVQAVFTGKVTQYIYKPSSLATEGAIPLADFSLSLIDTATGQTIWTGKGAFSPSGVLAEGTTPITDVVQDGVTQLLDAFYSGIGQKPAAPQGMCWYDPNTIFSRVVVANQATPLYAEGRQSAPATGPAQQQVASVKMPEQPPREQLPPAKVSVLNASGNPKAAVSVGVTLIKNKISVVNVSAQKPMEPRSAIYYKPVYQEQALAMAKLFRGVPRVASSQNYQWDITLVIGTDFKQLSSVHRPEQVLQEQTAPAKVSVLNASGSPKASVSVGVTLIKHKINVVNVSTEKTSKPKSTLYYKPAYQEQALAIARLLKKTPKLVRSEAYAWDITLIIGRDLK